MLQLKIFHLRPQSFANRIAVAQNNSRNKPGFSIRRTSSDLRERGTRCRYALKSPFRLSHEALVTCSSGPYEQVIRLSSECHKTLVANQGDYSHVSVRFIYPFYGILSFRDFFSNKWHIGNNIKYSIPYIIREIDANGLSQKRGGRSSML